MLDIQERFKTHPNFCVYDLAKPTFDEMFVYQPNPRVYKYIWITVRFYATLTTRRYIASRHMGQDPATYMERGGAHPEN